MKRVLSLSLSLILVVFMLTACQPDPNVPKAISTGTATQIVGKYEDCTFYHTKVDTYPDISWVRCKKEPNTTTTQIKESCGKSCTRIVTTQTIEQPLEN